MFPKILPNPRTNPLFKRSHHSKHALRLIFIGSAFFLSLWVLYHSPPSRITITNPIPFSPPAIPPEVWAKRAEKVKDAFLHAWAGYEGLAAPHDELLSVSNRTSDGFNGWGVTLIDSLDTMLLMGLNAEFERALPHVNRTQFTLEPGRYIPFFETVIRYLGGLLSAYALSRRPILLERADDLGRVLEPAFNSTSGMPAWGVDPVSGLVAGGGMGVLAELGTCQMEFAYLGHLTGKKQYTDRANKLMKSIESADLTRNGGMMPLTWNTTSGQPIDEYLFLGGAADSGHEYLLKYYLLTARTDKESLKMYLRMATHILTELLHLSPTRSLLYPAGAAKYVGKVHKVEHLACFLPGLFALAAHTLPLDDLSSLGLSPSDYIVGPLSSVKSRVLSRYSFKSLHLWAADGLTQTCYTFYADQPTGLGPEVIFMRTYINATMHYTGGLWIDALDLWRGAGARGVPPGLGEKKRVVWDKGEQTGVKVKGERDYVVGVRTYVLRPETIESLYLMWRVTGQERWRVWGWEIFEAIEMHTKTASGYSTVGSVEVVPPPLSDSMPSFFLAETLKYLYLLFIDRDPVPLDKWVFNTEAHPFLVFNVT